MEAVACHILLPSCGVDYEQKPPSGDVFGCVTRGITSLTAGLALRVHTSRRILGPNGYYSLLG